MSAVLIVVPLAWLLFERLHKTRHFYQYLFFCRFPLLGGLALTGLPILAVSVLNDFIGNWFQAIGLVYAFATLFFVLLSARTLCNLVRIIFLIAPFRTRLNYMREPAGALGHAEPVAYERPEGCVYFAMLLPFSAWSWVMVSRSEDAWQVAARARW